MSKQLTFIPASEAAEMAGVSTQTIRNLCKAKTIRFQRREHFFYPCKEDIEKYAQAISEINQIERDIEDYKKDINKTYEQLRDTKKEVQERLDDMNMFPEQIQNITHLLARIVSRYSNNLTDREAEIVLLILQGKTLTEVGKKFNLSRERIRQIWEKAVYKISNFPTELQQKDESIADMSRTIHDLEDRLIEQGIETTPYSRTKLLEKPIRECDFSFRVMNCLQAAEINTVGDLIQYPRASLRRFRNFGQKGLQELDEWLVAHGLGRKEDER